MEVTYKLNIEEETAINDVISRDNKLSADNFLQSLIQDVLTRETEAFKQRVLQDLKLNWVNIPIEQKISFIAATTDAKAIQDQTIKIAT